VLRPLLACKWILAKGTPPPMEFAILMKEYLDEDIKPDVQKLLDIKMNTPEVTEGKKMDRVNEYLERTMEEMEAAIDALPPSCTQGWDELNTLFLEIVQ
jgi:predicted nucleotidyltransferase